MFVTSMFRALVAALDKETIFCSGSGCRALDLPGSCGLAMVPGVKARQ